MDKKLVLDLANHSVYYVKTDTFSYYITIPKNFDTTNICIELKSKMDNYNLDMNDEIWVMENVKNTFSYIDSYNITLILPILNEEEISVLEKMDTNKYETLDIILAKTINGAYLNLKEAGKNIGNQVIQMYNVNATAYKKIETPAISFVVGSYSNEVDAPKVIHEPEKEAMPAPQLQPQMSSGFTSYWLLVAITIIVAGIVAILAFTMK